MKTAMHQNSLDAYKGINLTARQSDVVRALRVLGAATDQQIADLLEWPINRVCGRISELKEIGAVGECGNVIGEFGKRVRVCKLREYQETLF